MLVLVPPGTTKPLSLRLPAEPVLGACSGGRGYYANAVFVTPVEASWLKLFAPNALSR